ncbi:MAG: hypothetical protein IT462_07020 [Planctomycetes bacterium]|nr:hypothetical protein [Planctomycetota bacterium]
MNRWLGRIIPRETLLDRGAQHPLTLMSLLLITIAQVVIYVLELSHIPVGRMLSLDLANPKFEQLFFVLTHYAPVSRGAAGMGFIAHDFVASLLLFSICAFSLLTCGPLVEAYLGTRKTFLCFLLATSGHALLASALPPMLMGPGEPLLKPAVFGSLAFCTFLITFSLLISLESREDKQDADNDLRVAMLMLSFALVGVFAGFLAHPAYDSLLPAVAVGPVAALAAFVSNRRMQMRSVTRQGAGQVGKLYFVEEVDLLTKEEIQSRMDRLLEKISSAGMDSLSGDEKRFLSKASGRLKTQEHGEPR